jgi:Tfp pilus assembly protein PilX
MKAPQRQSGSVLIVVVLLLALAGILTLFGLNSGVFEQRMSASDLRAKAVGEVAQAGLSQGIEYIHQHYADMTDASKWTQCTATDTTFPCGSIPATRRATMYYWSSGGYDFDGNSTISGWEARMLPLADTGHILQTATFPAKYGVGVVICRVATKTLSTDPTTCTDSGSATNTSILTFVSVGAIPGENARTTVTQSMGSYEIINNLPDTPPIVASGSINLVGTIQVVTNPNAGGTGVPVSLWTPKSLNGNGTGNTCYANEYYSSGGTVDWSYASTLPTFPLCDDCSCNGSLSYAHGNTVSNGIDSLSADDNSATGGNAGVTLSADPTKTEFPCDLFQQIFGVQAWADNQPTTGTPPGDGFCETHIMTTYTNPNNSTQVVRMGVDEAYLYANAGYVKPLSGRTYACVSGCTGTLTATQLIDAGQGQGTAKTSGLVWCQDGSLCAQGSPAAPVLLVFDGTGPNLTNSGNVYGMIFGRSTGGSTGVLDASTGGDASFTMSGNGVVYGSIVLQGSTGHLNGTSAVVYNQDVLTVLKNNGSFVKFAGVPGSWSDRVSY